MRGRGVIVRSALFPRGFVGGELGFVDRSGSGAAQPALVSIDVTPDAPSVAVTATQQMTATGTYEDATTADITSIVSWSSDNESFATVSSSGLVTGVGAGTATITATRGAISGNEDVTVTSGRDTVALAHVTTSASTTDGTVFDTASFTPVVGQVYYVACGETGVAQSPTLNHDGFGGGFTSVDTEQIGGSVRLLSVFRGVCTSAVADTITMTYASSQGSALWSVVTGTGINNGGTNGADSVVQTAGANSAATVTTLNTTLAAFEDATNVNLTFVFTNANATVTPDGDFAELGDAGIASGTGTIESQWATNQTTCDPTWASAAVAMISIEIKSAGA